MNLSLSFCLLGIILNVNDRVHWPSDMWQIKCTVYICIIYANNTSNADGIIKL